MKNLLAKICFALSISLNLGHFIAKLMFDEGQTSFMIAAFGLGIVLAPLCYRSLSTSFATRLVIVSKEKFAEELEKEMKRKVEENK